MTTTKDIVLLSGEVDRLEAALAEVRSLARDVYFDEESTAGRALREALTCGSRRP